MEIRPMRMDDYDEVFVLWSHTKGMGMRSLDDSKDGLSKFLKRNPRTCFVAWENGVILGSILCGHDGRRGYIYHTSVKEEFRHRGIGRALVSAVLEALKGEDIHKVALVAFQSNDSGNLFWKSLGFEKRADLVYWNLSLNDQNY